MLIPELLKQGDLIGVPAPSDGSNCLEKEKRFLNAKKRLEDLGYQVKLSDNIFNSVRGRSSSAIKRANEINDMFQDKNIKIMLCAAGGDFLIEILPYIDYNLIKNNPKWLIGFSDPTGLLYSITTKCDIATIYGTNFGNLGSKELDKSQENFLEIITGNLLTEHSYDLYEETRLERITGLEGYNLTEKVIWKTLDNKDVVVTGRIIGGCLDVISTIAGTKYDGIKEFNHKYKDDGLIWYFDNCELSFEETIRVLFKLHELDYFRYAKAIIFGRFGSNQTSYDYTVKTCLEDSIINKLNIPIIYDADISHKGPCLNIINGVITTIEVKNNKGLITFKLD